MEVVSSDFGNFHVMTTPDRSPPSSSPSPEQHDTRRGSEHSWHIIVEPQLDGQTNVIHLMNPPSGQIISSFLAENGVHIEIQPGVFFRVPFPHEHGYHYGTTQMQMPPYQTPYQSPDSLGSSLGEDEMSADVPPYYVYNPACVVHSAGAGTNTVHCNDSSDDRVEKQREKLQKKLREKNLQSNQCTCFARQNGSIHDSYPAFTPHTPSKGSYGKDDTNIHSIDGTCPEIIGGENIALKAQAQDPYSIVISWDDGNAAGTAVQIHQFQLECSNKGNNFKHIYRGDGKWFTACELLPGTDYKFRICAVVDEIFGTYSDVVTCSTPSTVPDRPVHPRISQRTKNMLMLKWNAPHDGGSPISQYKLQWSKGEDLNQFSDLYVGLQKQYKHNHGLPPLTRCMFRIQAENQIGSSEFSDPLECLTSAGLPGIPEKPTVESYGIDFITLTWVPPECNGAPIEEYRLEMEDPNDGYGFIAKYCGEKLSYTCTNLWRNTAYKFRLLASNNQGSSKYSSTVEYSTLAETPGKMDKVKLNGKAKTHALPVKWEPPKDNGGEEIIGYILQSDSGEGGELKQIYHGPDVEFTVENLKGGTTYQFNVASESKAGIGPFSPIGNLTTLPVSPRNLSSPRLSKQDLTSLYLEWDPPLEIGGSPIINYIVKMAETPKEEFKQVYSGDKLCCLVTGLECGSDYYFKMQATNAVGPSPWTKIVDYQTIPGPPSAVSSLMFSFKSPTHIRFDWTEPPSHGSPITGYCLEKLESEIFHKVYEGNCLYCEVKRNLHPANIYFFRIQALSNAGSSPYSAICTVETPPGAPGNVADIKVLEQTSSSCLIQWRNPTENGSRVFEYVIEATGATSLVTTVKRPTASKDNESSCDGNSDVGGDASSHDGSFNESDDTHSDRSAVSITTEDNLMEYRLTGLTADASYKLRIQAVNEVGTSPFSHVVHFFTKELPPAPPTLTASSLSYHSVKLRWGESVPKKHLQGTSHNLQVQDKCGSFSTVYNGMGTSFTLNKLKELTPYCCRIKSRNDAGEGDYSKPVVVYTKAQPPSAIKDLRSKDLKEDNLLLVWNVCDKLRHDDVIEYVVQKLHQDHEKEFVMIYRGEDNECGVDNLQADQVYQFRVQAIRTVSADAFNNAPSPKEQIKGVSPVNTNNREIKGIYSPVVRVKTLCKASVQQEHDDDTEKDDDSKDDVKTMSDTQITMILLGTFLGICILTVILLRGIISEY